MVDISIIRYLPLYSWSSWLYGIFFSLTIHSQQLTWGLIALNCWLIVDCCCFPFLRRSSRYIHFRLCNQTKKTQFDWLLIKVKHFEGYGQQRNSWFWTKQKKGIPRHSYTKWDRERPLGQLHSPWIASRWEICLKRKLVWAEAFWHLRLGKNFSTVRWLDGISSFARCHKK